MSNEILIYESENNLIEVQLDTELETLWLNLRQISDLFERDKSVISRHLRNIFKDNELEKAAVVAKNATTAADGKIYQVDYYNLDAIISVGYRVNSKKGTQFRQWATARIKEHLIQGYTLNEQRLCQHQQQLKQLEQTLSLFQQNVIDQANLPEAQGLVKVIADYAHTFVLLNQYDSEKLPTTDFDEDIRYQINYEEARDAIALLVKDLIAKGEATELVGNEKDDSFAGVLGSVVQSFGGEYLYPSIEAQAAHLLYFIIKNHPFNDGNKRIGAFMFIWFLQRNKHHLKKSGELKINDNALAAIALLVAQSDPAQKELMIHLIMNLIR
ncbi:RhuM family protein [Litoribrevibacter euphylliae]|uniref:RhuM family protein n=1 Tax=Litoribrevibacter euphylliae TaxID=1834034 RepID=A0ABV7HFY0_9GAMM